MLTSKKRWWDRRWMWYRWAQSLDDKENYWYWQRVAEEKKQIAEGLRHDCWAYVFLEPTWLLLCFLQVMLMTMTMLMLMLLLDYQVKRDRVHALFLLAVMVSVYIFIFHLLFFVLHVIYHLTLFWVPPSTCHQPQWAFVCPTAAFSAVLCLTIEITQCSEFHCSTTAITIYIAITTLL